MNFPNEQILSRVIDGDEAAFAQIYTHFRSPAVKFCTLLLKDQDEAENVTQDVFAKIWDRRVQINPDYSFQSYLFVSLRNQIFDQFKKLEKDQKLKQQYIDRMNIWTSDDSDDKEDHFRAGFRTLLIHFRRKENGFLKLNVEEGKSYREIAVFLNISTNTVKNSADQSQTDITPTGEYSGSLDFLVNYLISDHKNLT